MTDIAKRGIPAPSVPEGYPPHIPNFATAEEARDFWDTHSSAPYFYEGEDVTHNPPPELRRGPGRAGSRAPKRPDAEHVEMVQLMMHEDTFAAVKKLAAKHRTSYHTLMNAWIEEGLKRDRLTVSNDRTD
mgnify:CR=1 FL=1